MRFWYKIFLIKVVNSTNSSTQDELKKFFIYFNIRDKRVFIFS